MEKKRTRPGMNWKTMISAKKPRNRMRRMELPFTMLSLAAMAGVTQPTVASNVPIRVFLALSF